jgi:hypothetical protein
MKRIPLWQWRFGQHVHHPTPLERRPYIPAGCDQQRRLCDGARAELPHRVGLGVMPVVAIVGGSALSALVFWMWLWF